MAVTKKVRFEVFKRDKFQCQYCGAKAPDVVLQVDHIEPSSKGGTNDLLNLVTSCAACNSGKSNKRLSDDSAVAKSRAQIEELQSRREQIEMMLRWKDGARNLHDEMLQSLAERLNKRLAPRKLTENGIADLRKLLGKFEAGEIVDAIDIACDSYLQFADDGAPTVESAETALGKIGGICKVSREQSVDPDTKTFYSIRALLRHRHGNATWIKALIKTLREWRDAGLPAKAIQEAAMQSKDADSFFGELQRRLQEVRNAAKRSRDHRRDADARTAAASREARTQRELRECMEREIVGMLRAGADRGAIVEHISRHYGLQASVAESEIAGLVERGRVMQGGKP